jgi:hypothetical protein
MEFGQAGAQQPGVGAGEEQCVAQALAGDLISVGAGDAFDGTDAPMDVKQRTAAFPVGM